MLRDGSSVLDVDGTGRSFHAWVPSDAGRPDDAGSTERPTVILLHGFNGNASGFAATTGLDRLAPEAGIHLVAPQGAGEPTTWHIGGPDDPLVANDTAFLDQLLDQLAASPCVDADNIWLAGFSAGSAYTGVYGCSNVDRFAGLAMVSGLPPAICPDDASVSIQITHGTADAIVPFGGGDQAISDDASLDLGSVPASAAGWAERAGCGGSVELSYGDVDSSDVTLWSNCRDGARVSLLAVDGLNHVWAGGESPEFLEPINPIINAGCVMVTTIVLATMTENPADAPSPFETCFGEWPA